MAPKKQQSKAEGGKKKENNKGGGNKATTSTEDNDCADMPPLEDMRKTDTTGEVKGKGREGGKEGKKEVKLAEIRRSEGQTPLGVAFSTKDVREAYRMLDIDIKLSDEELLSVLHDKLTNLVSKPIQTRLNCSLINEACALSSSSETRRNLATKLSDLRF